MSKQNDLIRKNTVPLLLALLAIAVRVIYLLGLSKNPTFILPLVDEKWHWEWAHEILNGSFFGEGAYFRAPLYPYFLALLAKLTGSSVLGAKILQSLLSGVTSFFLFKLSEKLFSRRVAIFTALVYAFYGTLVFYETAFLIPGLFLMLTVWGMYRLVAYRDNDSVKTWILTGIVFGLAALARPNILLTVPVLMIWRYWIGPKGVSFMTRARRPLLLLAGLVIAILPVTVRNVIVTGDLILISSQGGINLHLGNNPYANGLTMLMPEVDLDESVTWRDFNRVTLLAAEREAGHPLSSGEESSFWTGKALKFMVDDPGKFLGLVGKKTLYLLTGFENSDNSDLYFQRHKSTLYSWLVWDKPIYFPFGLLMPLALLGIAVLWDRRGDLAPIYLFLIAYVPTIVLFLVTARHRLPLVPFLIMIAVAGVGRIWTQKKQYNARQFILAGLALVVVILVLNRTYFDQRHGSDFQAHYNEGLRYQRLEDWSHAEQEYLLADEDFPGSAPLANNLGFTQFMQEKYELAAQNYHRAITLNPDYAPAYNNLGQIVYLKGEIDSAFVLFQTARTHFDRKRARAKDLGQVLLNLGDVFEDKGQIDSARMAFDSAVYLDSLSSKTYTRAAAFFARHQEWDRTDSLYKWSFSLQGDLTAVDYFNWALSFVQRGRLESGVNMMDMCLKRDSTIYQAYYVLALAYQEGGHPPDSALKYLDKCLRFAPDYEPAVQMKKLLLER
ncbi:MAG TPA: glycosyltransferase family 39 protein [candidate division Zixibacteria bacterium]|nr:glycosyltransferase family 39 protein [candidate division Zixibacteria bacterium]